MSVEQSAVLADFARACKAAVRSVSLYPGTHPAIRAALARVSSAAARLTAAADVTLAVHPDVLAIDGYAPSRPDPAVAELASLLHERLVGELHIERSVEADDWLALLLLLSRAPDELIAGGGIRKAWAGTGRSHFGIREIDYAEVLRERAGSEGAAWDRIVAYCLHRDSASLDDRALALLLEAASDPARFGELLDKLQTAFAESGVSMGARAAALLHLLQTAVAAAKTRGPAVMEQVLKTIADSSARLTPEMMLALLAQRDSPDGADASVASAVVDRINDTTVASFVANAVIAERGATERLAHAFEALVPEAERKERLLELAEREARKSEPGQESGFDELWRGAADMLTSYSDKKFVSDDYARELSSARTQAIEVERVSDDPPERVQQWVATVSDTALRELDLNLLLDLLRVEDHPDEWAQVAAIVAVEIERRALLGDIAGALRLAEAIGRERGPDGRAHLAKAASGAAEHLAAGPLVRHIVPNLRKADEAGTSLVARLCHTIGPGVVRPLAEALAVEDHHRAIRTLREILLDFGAAGRQSVEQLKTSSNPAVRRTAIDLLRVFGGAEALPELASMLGDADPQVQREAIRAIVHIGTQEAYAVLERALLAGTAARETLVQQLIGLREDKAVPLLCYVLNHTQPRGKLAKAHADIIDALGALKAHPESARTLKNVLYRGDWWAPFKTAALREAAASALVRIGSPDAAAVLEEAARTGSRKVRRIARAKAAMVGRRERERA